MVNKRMQTKIFKQRNKHPKLKLMIMQETEIYDIDWNLFVREARAGNFRVLTSDYFRMFTVIAASDFLSVCIFVCDSLLYFIAIDNCHTTLAATY